MLLKTNVTRALFFFIGDVVLSFLSLYLAYLLRFNFEIPDIYFHSLIKIFLVLTFFKVFYLALFKLYFVSWRFFSIYELKRLFFSILLAYFSFFIVYLLFKDFLMPFPRSAILIDFFLSIIFIGFFRISKRLFLTTLKKELKPAIVIGANEKTISLLNQEIPFTILKIYDKGEIVGSYIRGYKVEDLENISSKIKTAIITKDLNQSELNALFEFLKTKGIEDIKIYNPLYEKIKDISIEDLLARKPKDLDKEAIRNFIKDKKILITGAGGSIGSEISKQCEEYGAKKLILVENSEFNLYSINEELNIERKAYLVDVSKYEEIKRVFEVEKPDVVIHTAAYKHVSLCEENPRSAIINNIIGTKNVIDLAIENKVKNFILISTDKAVRPTSIMGATKRVCELYAQNVDSKVTKISAVRFGNVLGSSGSVVPKFNKFIQKNKPLPVTHPEVTRYFMLISEACELVLQAGSMASDGEIFILDMGEPIKIVDLAKKMLKLSGKREDNIVFVGLGEGEKLYEELLINEAKGKTKYKDILIGEKEKFDFEKLNNLIYELSQLTEKRDIIKKLKEIVKEFNHKELS